MFTSIVGHFDDMAYNPSNPFPGQVFNQPTGALPGLNVYVDIPKDYTGENVNAQNFMAVLTGDAATATGPVLHSTPHDDVFVAFFNHGGNRDIVLSNWTLSNGANAQSHLGNHGSKTNVPPSRPLHRGL